MLTPPAYLCVDDRYDPDGSLSYTLEEFRAMCRECFGEEPELREEPDGSLTERGNVVLTPIPDKE
jgi:hypothetical protein